MYLHFGQKMFGKCDIVPELFWVGTFFFHVNFVPLIPLGTHLVLGESGEQYASVRIPFSFKSLFYAWMRAATFLAAIVFWIIFVVMLNEPRRDESLTPMVLLASGCTLLFLFLMIYPRRVKPTYQRACELAMLAGLNERGWAALNVLYDRNPLDRPNPTS